MWSPRFPSRILLSGLATLALGPGPAYSASFMPLGSLPTLPAFSAVGLAISGDGTTVVGMGVLASQGANNGPFRWTASNGFEILFNLAPLGGDAAPLAVSSDGSVVVGSFSRDGGQAFLWTAAGGLVVIGDYPEGLVDGRANGVSGDGTIVVGTGLVTAGAKAFRWTSASGMQALGSLPGGVVTSADGISSDGLVIVGSSDSSQGTQAYRWTSETGMVGLGDLAGGQFASVAKATSADGSVVVGWGTSGAFSSPGNGRQAIRWTSSEGMVGLGFLPEGSAGGEARAVSGDGQIIVGKTINLSNAEEAFVWTKAAGMRRLSDALIAGGATGLQGWTLTVANGISADGQWVTGWGVNPQGNTEGFLASLSLATRPDTDWDGIADDLDNCTQAPNASQLDSDGDLFGNACDPDLNNSGTVTTADYGLLRSVLGQPASASPLAAAADLDGNGTVTTADFGRLRSMLGRAPGPSGLTP